MVIFSDLSEVLIGGLFGFEEILAEKFAVSPEGKAALASKLDARRSEINDLFLEVMRGRICEDAYWKEFFSNHPWVCGPDDAKVAFQKNMRRTIPGTLKMYQRIIAHPESLGPNPNYTLGMSRIYLTSDHIRGRVEWLEVAHPEVFRVVSGAFWSCDIGAIKQDRRFFLHALSRTGVEPNEVIFIDDLDVNVAAAERFGIRGIVFHDAKQLEDELRDTYGFRFAPEIP